MSIGWGDFPGPRHEDEVMTAHDGQPSLAMQDATHGAGLPDVDLGMDEGAKYGSSPSAC